MTKTACARLRLMATCISHSASETEALGESWGHQAQAGLVIGLCGDLGAGKTSLVKGLARGLGILQRVHSPTFALIHVYQGGRLTLFHLDLYRLQSRHEIFEAGLEEFLQPQGVTVIEWADRWFPEFQRPASGDAGRPPAGARPTTPGQLEGLRLLWVQIETLSESQRRIRYENPGA